MIELDQLYIVNYCHPRCLPLKNIMRLEQEAAFALAHEMSAENLDTTAFYRFADFSNYYPLRQTVDQILHQRFVALGGKPLTKHPLFFVIHGSEYLQQWFGNGTVRKILLSQIPPEHISFTYGDSCATWRKKGDIQLVSKAELLASIRNFSGTVEDYLQQAADKYIYIEAQLWSDEYIGSAEESNITCC